MINYIEKGYGLHEEIAKAGHWIAQHDGVWISSDDNSVQKIIDNYKEPLKLKLKKLFHFVKK